MLHFRTLLLAVSTVALLTLSIGSAVVAEDQKNSGGETKTKTADRPTPAAQKGTNVAGKPAPKIKPVAKPTGYSLYR
jgi:hypothetical protein